MYIPGPSELGTVVRFQPYHFSEQKKNGAGSDVEVVSVSAGWGRRKVRKTDREIIYNKLRTSIQDEQYLSSGK